jgi:uncharacterized protein (DUF1697 family)
MPRHIALLRAINVGGHTVTMAALRAEFEALGLANVETFIASGNVIFTSSVRDIKALEKRVERQLEKSLGYEVKTFIRTDAELAAVARYKPFSEAERRAAKALVVGFLSDPLDSAQKKTLMTMRTAIDDFHVHGREVYWMCRERQSDSKFANAVFERSLKVRATWRGMNTVERLAAKHCSP